MILNKKILFICGSLNQTTMMHSIASRLPEHQCFFTPYYADGFIDSLVKKGMLKHTVLSGRFRQITEKYLLENNLPVDFRGSKHNYDLIFTCSDLIVQKNILGKKIILVQEGMTDPENLMYYITKYFKLPRYLASTSTTGLSHSYEKFCVASEGYKELFIRKGVDPDKIEVTGIPNFDNCIQYYNNSLPYKNYILVATSDARETFKFENRIAFIKKALKIARGKQIIFKLHPNEKFNRAEKEIKSIIPQALIFQDANVNELIANCDILITKYSSVVYVGLALGKEVYSYFNIEELKKLMPIQNGGTSAINIANVARASLNNAAAPFQDSVPHNKSDILKSIKNKIKFPRRA